MQSTTWMLFIVSIIIQPLHNVGLPVPGDQENPVSVCEASIIADQDAAKMLKQLMNEVKSNLSWYKVAVGDILKPRYDAVELQNQLNSFHSLVRDQLSTASNLKTNLADHETQMNVSLTRQEEQLSLLEHQLPKLEHRWQNQTSELEQLKQLWNDLGNKSVERAAEVKVLNQSIKGVEERLAQLESKVDEQALAAESLDGVLEGAEDALKELQDELQEALNTQGRLDGALIALQREVAELQAKSTASAPVVVHSQADTLCKRLSV